MIGEFFLVRSTKKTLPPHAIRWPVSPSGRRAKTHERSFTKMLRIFKKLPTDINKVNADADRI